jgi:RNA polymerase sigma-70 factor (ECF subfamily)
VQRPASLPPFPGPVVSAIDPRAEAEITDSFLSRDANGLANAYRLYARSLFSVALSVLADCDDAQDCVHDALLRVWVRPGSYRPERGSLRSFLLTCVRNEAITRKRAAQRHLRIEEFAARSAQLVYEFEIADVVDRGRLRVAIASLPAEQRLVLAMAYVSHLSHSEIAEQLNEPLGTIKGRVRLALLKLHAALQPPVPLDTRS